MHWSRGHTTPRNIEFSSIKMNPQQYVVVTLHHAILNSF